MGSRCILIAVLWASVLLLFPRGALSQEKTFAIGEGTISLMAISPKSDLLAVDDLKPGSKHRIIVFDIKKEKTIGVFHDESPSVIEGIAFTNDNKALMSFKGKNLPSGEGGTIVRFWDIESMEQELARSYSAKGQGIAMTDRFLVTRRQPTREAFTHHVVRVFDLHERKQIAVLKNLPAQVDKAALSADGKYLAIRLNHGREAEVKVFELPSAKELDSFRSSFSASSRMIFLKSNSTLALAGSGIAIRDPKTRDNVEKAEYGARNGITISSDGKTLVCLSDLFLIHEMNRPRRVPKGLHILSREKKKVIASFHVDPTWGYRHLQFTPDARSVIAVGSGGIIRVWDVSKLKP